MLNFQGHGFLVRQMIPKVRNQKVHHQHSSSNQTKPFWIQCIAMQTQPTTRYVTTRSSWAVSHISAVNPQCGSHHTPPQNGHFGAAVILWQRRICLFQLCAKTNERFFSFHAKTESEYDFKKSFYHQVTYSVNADGGYVAEVSYEGTAVFPEVKENQSPQTKLNQKFTFCPGEALCPSSCGNRLVSNLYDVAFTVFRRSL